MSEPVLTVTCSFMLFILVVAFFTIFILFVGFHFDMETNSFLDTKTMTRKIVLANYITLEAKENKNKLNKAKTLSII